MAPRSRRQEISAQVSAFRRFADLGDGETELHALVERYWPSAFFGGGPSVAALRRERADLREVLELWNEVSAGRPRSRRGRAPDLQRDRNLLVTAINVKLQKHCVPRMSDEDLSLGHAANNFFGTVWLSLAQHISRGRKEDTCSVCGETFTPMRAGAMFCSPACKMVEVRRRQREGKLARRKP
jgi:hypothetical protein